MTVHFDPESLLEAHPNIEETVYFAQYAYALLESKEIKKARAVAEKGVMAHPDYLAGHLICALCLKTTGNLAEAKKHYKVAFDLDNRCPRAIKGLVDIAAEQQDDKEWKYYSQRLAGLGVTLEPPHWLDGDEKEEPGSEAVPETPEEENTPTAVESSESAELPQSSGPPSEAPDEVVSPQSDSDAEPAGADDPESREMESPENQEMKTPHLDWVDDEDGDNSDDLPDGAGEKSHEKPIKDTELLSDDAEELAGEEPGGEPVSGEEGEKAADSGLAQPEKNEAEGAVPAAEALAPVSDGKSPEPAPVETADPEVEEQTEENAAEEGGGKSSKEAVEIAEPAEEPSLEDVEPPEPAEEQPVEGVEPPESAEEESGEQADPQKPAGEESQEAVETAEPAGEQPLEAVEDPKSAEEEQSGEGLQSGQTAEAQAPAPEMEEQQSEATITEGDLPPEVVDTEPPEAVTSELSEDSGPSEIEDAKQEIASAPSLESRSQESLLSKDSATPTLAEIYFQQGVKKKALDLYRKLLEKQPDNEEYARRCRDIEASIQKDLEQEEAPRNPPKPKQGLRLRRRRR